MSTNSKEIRFSGFPHITQPSHLLEKMKHDLDRMHPNRLGSYAMYDFFVTADNLCGWWWEYTNRAEKLSEIRGEHPLRRVVAQIANSAKHYRADDKRHQSVFKLFKDGYAEDYFAEDYVEEHPTAELEEEVASDLSISGKITLQDLALLVYKHWEGVISMSAKT